MPLQQRREMILVERRIKKGYSEKSGKYHETEEVWRCPIGSQSAGQSRPIIKERTSSRLTTHAYVIDENGRRDLTREQYEKLVADTEKNHPYDMFIDGCSLYCYKKELNEKIKSDTLDVLEFALLREYIEDDFCNRPELSKAIKDHNRAISEAEQKRQIGHESAIKYLEKARGKVDIKLRRYGWHAFKRGNKIDPSNPLSPDYFHFDPPKELKYCLIVPNPTHHKDTNILRN